MTYYLDLLNSNGRAMIHFLRIQFNRRLQDCFQNCLRWESKFLFHFDSDWKWLSRHCHVFFLASQARISIRDLIRWNCIFLPSDQCSKLDSCVHFHISAHNPWLILRSALFSCTGFSAFRITLFLLRKNKYQKNCFNCFQEEIQGQNE